MGVDGKAKPRRLYPRPWVGPRAGLDRCGKSHPPPGLDPRTLQPKESRYSGPRK